jgi:hypothetical protein
LITRIHPGFGVHHELAGTRQKPMTIMGQMAKLERLGGLLIFHGQRVDGLQGGLVGGAALLKQLCCTATDSMARPDAGRIYRMWFCLYRSYGACLLPDPWRLRHA